MATSNHKLITEAKEKYFQVWISRNKRKIQKKYYNEIVNEFCVFLK